MTKKESVKIGIGALIFIGIFYAFFSYQGGQVQAVKAVTAAQDQELPKSQATVVLEIKTRPTWNLLDIASGMGMNLKDLLALNNITGIDPLKDFSFNDVKRIPILKVRPYSAFNRAWVSWYGEETKGTMANGEIFNPEDPTICAHRWLPFGTRVRLTRVNSGKSVVVIVKDRGPYADIEHRHFDVSFAAAQILEMIDDGVVECQIEIIP